VTTLSVLQIGAEVAPLVPGDLAESAAALARALGELGLRTTVLTLAPPEPEPAPPGFARRLRPLDIAGQAVDAFEGAIAKGLTAWLVRPAAGLPRGQALALAASAAAQEFGMDFDVAHAHGTEALPALAEIGRIRPSAARVATVSGPVAEEVDADAIVVPCDRPAGGALSIAPGVDDVSWNPAADPALPAGFSATGPAGKALCKRALRRALGLAPRSDVPLFALSSGEQRDRLAELTSGQLAGPEVSKRLLLAGADYFIAADDFVLDVLRALRYGAVPVVPEDCAAVVEHDAASHTGTGFHYAAGDEDSLSAAVARARRTYLNAEAMAQLRGRALAMDVSWRRPARRYAELFDHLARG
jgi:hypothetical protein